MVDVSTGDASYQPPKMVSGMPWPDQAGEADIETDRDDEEDDVDGTT